MTCLHSLYGFQPVIFVHTEMISAPGVPPSCTSALRVPTRRRDKKSTPSHALNGFPPGNFLLHGFGTRAKIQAAFSHSNLLLRNRDATVGSAFFLRHDSRSRHGKTAGSSCSWPWALRGDWTKPPPAPWTAEMGRPQWVDDASKKVTARPLNLLNASPTSPPA